MSTMLLSADLRSRRRSLAALGGGCFALLLLLCGTYSAYGGADAFDKTFANGTPKLLSAFSGSASGNIFRPADYLAFGFGHPLFLVLALSVAITIGVGAVAADVESGRAEMLFTAPVPRTSVLATRIAEWALAQGAVLAAAVGGALIGSRFSGDLGAVSPWVPLRVAAQFAALAVFVSAVSFAASARARTRSAALGVSVGVVAGSYLANLISLLWSPLGFLRWVEPFGYYSTSAAAGSFSWRDAGVLLVASAVLLTLAVQWVRTRDLA